MNCYGDRKTCSHKLYKKVPKRYSRSRSGSNQPETTTIEEVAKKVPKKIAKKVTKKVAKKGQGAKDVSTSLVPLDSPSMGTRSKKNTTFQPCNEYKKQTKT